VVFKDGALGGFIAQMAFLPDADTGVVVLTNIDFPSPAAIVQWRLVELLYDLQPKVVEFHNVGLGQFFAGVDDSYAQLLPVDLDSVTPYLGEYRSDINRYTIEWRDDGLWFNWGALDCVQLLGSPEGGYLSISPNNFYLPFQFAEGDDGGTTLVIAGGAIEAPKIVPSLNLPFQLREGQAVNIEPDGPWMEFLAVEEDSRCPLDVVCIQAGKAMVDIRVRFDAQASGSQLLTLEVGSVDANADQISTDSGVYQFEAMVLDPYPRASAQEPPEYVVTLTVTKAPR